MTATSGCRRTILLAKGPDMHGGLPIIGFSTLIYGAVGLTAVAGHAIKRLVKPGRRRP